jgi:hypothetical protein
MWKLLPLCLLVSCAVYDQQQQTSGENQPGQGRIVRQVELPVESLGQSGSDQTLKKTFQRQGIQGWVDETGAWHLSSEVQHGRLRCATYETGIQLGKGNPRCSEVEWLTGIEYGTRLLHCNSAARVHVGGGNFSSAAPRLEEVTCVRVVVRCEGTC